MALQKKILKNALKRNSDDDMYGFTIDMNVISKVKKILAGQSKDKKEFLKAIFKVYDVSLENLNEETFINLTSILNCREIEKIILALKYKQDLNYKEKIKIIEELTKDFSVEYFFTLDTIVRTYWNDLNTAQFKISNLPNLQKAYQYNEDNMDLLFKQIAILSNTMTLIRCIKYDYWKSNITAIDNNYKIKKSITNNKITAGLGPIFVIGDIDKVENKDIYECTKNMGKVSSYEKAMAYIVHFIGVISIDEITEDIYSKVILKDEYNTTVSNRMHNTGEVSYVSLNIKDFLRRKVLLPKSGVVLLVEDNPLIESILLKEKLGTYYNNLIIVTKYKDGREMINTMIIKEWELSTDDRMVNVNHLETIMEYPTTVDYVSSFFELYDENEYEIKPNYQVISPYYWKYRNKNYRSDNDEVNSKGIVIKREHSVEVAPFIRKINGEASEEAKKLSKKLGIILEDGYTIVKAHTRLYNREEN